MFGCEGLQRLVQNLNGTGQDPHKWLVVRKPLSTAHGVILTFDIISRPII